MENKENLPMKQGAMALDYSSKDMLLTLKQTVAVGTTDAEFKMFIEFCKGTGLNAFKKEVWCIVVPEKTYTDKNGNQKKQDRKVQIMTGINGFFTIANNKPEMDGYQEGFVDKEGNLVSAAYPREDYIGAWCRVYRKDRKVPTEAVVFLKEYDKGYGNWVAMKRTMILKCAESVALRKSFPQELNGMYTAEEMPGEYALTLSEPEGSSGAPIVTVTPSLVPADALPAPTGDVITFGKHKGKQWSEVPGDYLEWVWGQGGKDAGKAKAELDRRLDDQSLNINKEAEEAGAY